MKRRVHAEIKSSGARGRDRKGSEDESRRGRQKRNRERARENERKGRYPADEPAMKPRRTRCLFLQSMEGYIHGLMAVYHARLLRSLSCVLGAHMREREQETRREREREKQRRGDKRRQRERKREREGERNKGGSKDQEKVGRRREERRQICLYV